MKLRYGIVGTLAFLVIWETASVFSGFSVIVPIERIIASLPDTFLNKRFPTDLYFTLKVLAIGLFFSVNSGVLLAVVCHYFEKLKWAVMPMISFFKSMPSVCLIPIVISLFGFRTTGKVIIVFMTGFMVTFFNMSTSIERISKKDYVEASRICGCNRFQTMFLIILPNTIPDFINTIGLAISVSFQALFASEMMGATFGIGYRINDFSNSFRNPQMLGYLIFFCLLSLGIQKGISRIIKKIS